MMMAGAMTPANDDSTCCRVTGMRSWAEGTPSRLNSAGLSSVASFVSAMANAPLPRGSP